MRNSAQPDVLTGQSDSLTVMRSRPFTEPIAMFTDANITTTADRFTATVRWGDGHTSIGTISGSAGNFTVVGDP